MSPAALSAKTLRHEISNSGGSRLMLEIAAAQAAGAVSTGLAAAVSASVKSTGIETAGMEAAPASKPPAQISAKPAAVSAGMKASTLEAAGMEAAEAAGVEAAPAEAAKAAGEGLRLCHRHAKDHGDAELNRFLVRDLQFQSFPTVWNSLRSKAARILRSAFVCDTFQDDLACVQRHGSTCDPSSGRPRTLSSPGTQMRKSCDEVGVPSASMPVEAICQPSGSVSRRPCRTRPPSRTTTTARGLLAGPSR